MESKVKSSLWALDNGCGVVICNGMKYNTIRKIMRGQKVGSFFTKAEPDTVPVEILAKNARKGSRRLQSLSPTERAEIITNIGDALTRRTDEIININRCVGVRFQGSVQRQDPGCVNAEGRARCCTHICCLPLR